MECPVILTSRVITLTCFVASSNPKAKIKSGSQDRNSPEDPNLTAAQDGITSRTFESQHEKVVGMIADFINAFFHKVIQGYDTSGISFGAIAQVRVYTSWSWIAVPNTA